MISTRTTICGRSRNRAVLAVVGLLAGAAACSGQNRSTTPASSSGLAVTFALTTSALPTCGTSQDGQVYYVWSSSNFYVCRGSTRTWVQTNLNGLNAAVSVTAVNPGSQCGAGGSSIAFGLDQNRNGKLDSSEVSSTVVVCNGSTGAQGPQGPTGAKGATGAQGPQGTNGTNGKTGVNSLVRLDDEPAGANCPAGGVRIEAGLDLNGDGILSANEVTETSYTCNAVSTLINIVAEPAGPNCGAGGQAIQTGVDANHDGTLELAEVQHTSYVCGACKADPDCVEGNYCAAGVCLSKKGNGASCLDGIECVSGNCIDNVCCGSACGDCHSCASGTCTAQTDLTPCGTGGTGYCAAGVCSLKKVNGASCLDGIECVSGNCIDNVCCGSACGDCHSCASGTCTAQTDLTPCGTGGMGYCAAGVCSLKKVNGASCSGAIECVSGNCAGGVCR